MELLFESRPDIRRVVGDLNFFQCRPRVHPEPVLVNDSFVDGRGASIYGSVLRDGGIYRMWYQAWAKDWSGHDSALVGYAESDDGVTWRKPALDLVEYGGGKANNLCDLGVHCPTVLIDPTAPSSHRYRALGCVDSRYKAHNPAVDAANQGCFFAFHSVDGLHWVPDRPTCCWPSADAVYSTWHPGRGHAMAAVKMNRWYHDMLRRTWGVAAMKEGEWGEPKQALVPDDYDDIRAKTAGGISADYYGVGLMPAGRGVVGFIEQFRHLQPLRTTPTWGTYGGRGRPDVSLVYQSDEGAQWVHMPGRPDFLTHNEVPWARDGMYVGSNVEEFGQEQRLYFTGSMGGHMPAMPGEDCLGAIGFAAWPKWRLFGFCGRPEGVLDVELGRLNEPKELALNCKTAAGGSVRVEILTKKPYYELTPVEGRKLEDAVPLEGDSLEAVARWKGGSVIQPVREGETVLARLHIQWAEVFAFELRPAL